MSVKIDSDVLVIGGGGAAARAALEAHKEGARVAMVVKGTFGESGASVYQVTEMGAYNVADGVVDPKDSPDRHYEDIVRAAMGMCDRRLARVLVDDAIKTIPDLEALGVWFEREKDRYLAYKACFSTHPRSHVIKGHGKPIVNALKGEIEKRDIAVYDNMLVTDLLVADGRCVGAVGLDRGGELAMFRARAVILGAGGAGQLFKKNLNPSDITGDGYAIAFRAGADLINMEFMQAGVGVVSPILSLLNAWMWHFQPDLYNRDGAPFLSKYLPGGITPAVAMDTRAGHYPFSTIDESKYVDIAIHKEILEGRGTENLGIYLDLRGMDEANLPDTPEGQDTRRMWRLTNEYLRERNVDLREKPIEVACYGHAINGGVVIDESAQSTLPGLYAAGEVAGGPHGANRLGGNMLVTCQVFGARAGKFAAMDSKSRAMPEISEQVLRRAYEKVNRLRSGAGSREVKTLRNALQETMWRNALVVRSGRSLGKAMADIDAIQAELMASAKPEDRQNLWEIYELENLLQVGRIICTAANLREESRGSHYREDFPSIEEKTWSSSIVLHQIDGRLEHRLQKL
jgi:succinate dehydrogenase/fumarate reductase flavoprotein subunit